MIKQELYFVRSLKIFNFGYSPKNLEVSAATPKQWAFKFSKKVIKKTFFFQFSFEGIAKNNLMGKNKICFQIFSSFHPQRVKTNKTIKIRIPNTILCIFYSPKNFILTRNIVLSSKRINFFVKFKLVH